MPCPASLSFIEGEILLVLYLGKRGATMGRVTFRSDFDPAVEFSGLMRLFRRATARRFAGMWGTRVPMVGRGVQWRKVQIAPYRNPSRAGKRAPFDLGHTASPFAARARTARPRR